MNFIAPGMTDDQYEPSKRLEIYRSRTVEWILGFAVGLSNEKDGGISALILATSVIEPMGGILLPKSNTETRFKAGFEYIFPEVSQAYKDVYTRLRGGLFHEGFIKIGLILQELGVPIEVRDGAIAIDPVQFVSAVKTRFIEFCEKIKAESDLNSKFNEYWDRLAEVNVLSLPTAPVAAPATPPLMGPTTLTTSANYSNYSAAVPVDPRRKAPEK